MSEKSAKEKRKSRFESLPVDQRKVLNSIYHQLRIWMAAESISQNELERRTGVEQSNISKLLLGHQIPEISTLCKLAKAMGGSLEVTFVHGKK